HSLLRLLPPKRSEIVGGAMRFTRRDGAVVDLAQLDPRGARIRSIRGNEIAMIFQEPMTSLSPVHTVGSQIAEAVELHQNVGKVNKRLATIPGSVPDPFALPQGCTFSTRCPAPKRERCFGPEDVPLTEVKPGHWVRCTLYQ